MTSDLEVPRPALDGPVRPVLSVSHLAAGYGDLRVVWDVSFDVLPGQVLALLGRNGAGKTTILRAVSGLNRLDGGTILFKGDDISGQRVHRRVRSGIGFVQENKRIFHRRSTEENLMLGGYTLGLRRGRLRDAARDVYEIFPVLGECARAPAGELSGGQQQMLAIGQALMAKPSLLMLDEPSAGLAPSVVNEVVETVASLKAGGLAIVLVEQAVEAAVAVADRVVVLDVGRVVMDTPASEVSDLTALRDAYFGRTSDGMPAE